MLLPALLTLASLTVASVALLVIDCSSPALELLRGDPLRVCATVDSIGLGGSTSLGFGLAAVAVLALVAIWLPLLRRRNRIKEVAPTVALNRNLARLADLSVGSATRERSTVDRHAVRLARKLEAVEHALTTDSIGAREATEQWIGLLREANDLHNRDLLATEDFKRINTQLLDLFSGSGDSGDTDRVAATRG